MFFSQLFRPARSGWCCEACRDAAAGLPAIRYAGQAGQSIGLPALPAYEGSDAPSLALFASEATAPTPDPA